MAAFAQVAHPSRRTGPPQAASAPVSGRADHAASRPPVSRSLAALVAGEIIPRLILAHRVESPAARGSVAEPVDLPADLDVGSFTPLTLDSDPHPLLACVDRLLSQGVAAETLMVDLLAPAARLLGTWWEEDRCDFVEVTMGLWRLQEVVRELAARAAPAPQRPGRRTLFAAFPGDQHDFGAVMVSELFRRHGWESEMIVAADMTTLLAAVGRADYDLLGLTISCDCHSARLPSAILALRSVSRNPHMRVMIGGRVPNEDPALAGRAGADGTATDARDALRLAETLMVQEMRCAVCA